MLRTGGQQEDALRAQLVEHAVHVTRATREHPDVRQGSSVRRAIDLVLVASELASLREIDDPADARYPATLHDAMVVALSGRVQLDEVAQTTPEAVIREIWEDLVVLGPAQATPG